MGGSFAAHPRTVYLRPGRMPDVRPGVMQNFAGHDSW